MVDNRAAGFYGVAGAFNFKSGDISGTAAKTSDDRASQGTEYGQIVTEEEQAQATNKYVDNSAQLNATLNSLAMLNVASVINSKLPKYRRNPDLDRILEDAEVFVAGISSDEEKGSRRFKHHSNDEDIEDIDIDDEEDNEYY